tara:strand:- start:824 stop:1096 length:273 start_codon:yes stop_codon:yes gene_type:complete
MQTIQVKKSQLAQYKGLRLSNAVIATQLGVTVDEVIGALKHFGMYQERATVTKLKEYTIEYIDDLAPIVAVEETPSVESNTTTWEAQVLN